VQVTSVDSKVLIVKFVKKISESIVLEVLLLTILIMNLLI